MSYNCYVTDIVASVRKELQEGIDARTLSIFRRVFKEPVLALGVKTALVNAIARKHFKEVTPLGKKATFALCEELFKSGYCEEAFIAADWAYRLRSEYEPGDFNVFEEWISGYVDNWAKCDSLCNHAVGAFIERYPEYLQGLKRWTKSENRWLRRASAVSLVIPARRGKFLNDVFEIADSLLRDREDLVQKGYGWMLKEAGKLHQQAVFDYVMRNRSVMPRTALRYSIEKMPEDLRKQAIAKG